MTTNTSSRSTSTDSSAVVGDDSHSQNKTPLVDFIGPSKAVKHLFSLPYNTDVNVSVALHNMGNGTLLLDSLGGDDDFIGSGSDDYNNNGGAGVPEGGGGGGASNNNRNNGRRGRLGRRRQRPQGWSIKEEEMLETTPATTHSISNDTTTNRMSHVDEDGNNAEELNQLQLAQKGEDEEHLSLLTYLSLLLEEEKRQQHQNQKVLHEDDGEQDGNVVGDAHVNIIQEQGEEELHSKIGNTALVIPSNAIVVSGSVGSGGTNTTRNVGVPIIGTTTQHEHHHHAASIPSSNNPDNHPNNDPNDPLISKLHPPPQHYLSQYAGVSPPSEPRQYVDWKFHGMNLLIASDAVIYTNGAEEEGNNSAHHHNAVDNNEETTTTTTSMESSIAIRVANACDLKSQMKLHETQLKQLHETSLPPCSYAEALQQVVTPSSSSFEDAPQDDDYDKTAKDENKESGENGMANVKLQTCIIPSCGVVGPEWATNLEWAAQLGFSHHNSDTIMPVSGNNSSSRGVGVDTTPTAESFSSSPVCTVLDTYLDNIMANVPQLALILREHGFVQNIKLMRTEDIPSLMMQYNTVSTLGEEEGPAVHKPPEVFSPEIVEMNAAMLLRFLKTNCTRENSTYLLHRSAGEGQNIQLFDISSISKLRQRKWVWWLALCSYRFACRLEQLQTNNVGGVCDVVTRREYRQRQRSLLHNTLDLLEELADMDDDDNAGNSGGIGGGNGNGKGRRHETIGAAVCEHLADTYLWNDETDGDVAVRDSTKPAPCASSSQPYAKVTVDCLNKAHDHLSNGMKKLTPLLEKAKRDKESPVIEVEALSTQLYGILHKMVNVNLRLADHHLQNYFSSNLIQSLRTAARMLKDATSLLEPLDMIFQQTTENTTNTHLYAMSILLQYAWLWEYCGHFARSFAADGLWRDRGHTCGADLIGLFREVNALCGSIRMQCFGKTGAGGAAQTVAPSANSKKFHWKSKMTTTSNVGVASHGQVSLNSLTGIVILPKDFEQIEASVLQKEGCHEAIGAAKEILDRKSQIKRDKRLVLVAASVCYGHAIDSHAFLASHNNNNEEKDGGDVGKDNATTSKSKSTSTSTSTPRKDSVDALNLISKTPGAIVAPLLRQRLGDACNEIGKVLLDESRAVLLPQVSAPDNKKKISGGSMSNKSFGMSHVSAIMLASAQFWFLEGLEQFTEGKDLRNLALLRCNLCQVCKIRANTNVILPGTSAEVSSRKNNSESYLQEAVDYLVSAHEALGQRDADPVTWDMVSEELAATLLVLGVRRRQSTLSSSSPEPLVLQALRLTPGADKAIVEPMERSCQIYESLGTSRASHQAAAAHYQLALYFSKVWTCQRDEVKTREKLAAAFEHYASAHQYFFQHIQGNETTFVVLSLDISNLYSAVSGERCLSKALLCCLDTRMAFSLSVEPAAREQMTTLADNVEARVSKLLLSLVKIEKENNSKLQAGQMPSEIYKNMYRKVLGHKMMSSGGAGSIDQEENSDNPPYTYQFFELLKGLYDLSKS